MTPVPWYQVEPFRTLLGVVVGSLLTIIGSFVANWWLKRLEIRAKADALKVAFQAEVGALRAALRADVEQAEETLTQGRGSLRSDVKYARVIFDHNAGQIGDIRDSDLVRQLAGFYTMLDRLEELGGAEGVTTSRPDRVMASLGSALYMATLLDMRLADQTAGFVPANFPMTVTEQDARDQRLAKTIMAKYGDQQV